MCAGYGVDPDSDSRFSVQDTVLSSRTVASPGLTVSSLVQDSSDAEMCLVFFCLADVESEC